MNSTQPRGIRTFNYLILILLFLSTVVPYAGTVKIVFKSSKGTCPYFLIQQPYLEIMLRVIQQFTVNKFG